MCVCLCVCVFVCVCVCLCVSVWVWVWEGCRQTDRQTDRKQRGTVTELATGRDEKRSIVELDSENERAVERERLTLR